MEVLTTNRLNAIDLILERPGRFGSIIKVLNSNYE